MPKKFDQLSGSPVFPIDTLDDPEYRIVMGGCSIVVGVDCLTHDQHVFHGDGFINETARAISEGREVIGKHGVFRVAVDFAAGDAERLAEAVIAVKGSCCYRAGEA